MGCPRAQADRAPYLRELAAQGSAAPLALAGMALAGVGPPERQTMASISTLGDFVSAAESSR